MLVRELQDSGIRLAVATSQSLPELASELEQSGLGLDDFAAVSAGMTMQNSKEESADMWTAGRLEPASLQQAVQQLGVPPTAVVVLSSVPLDAPAFREAGDVPAVHCRPACLHCRGPALLRLSHLVSCRFVWEHPSNWPGCACHCGTAFASITLCSEAQEDFQFE